MFAPCHDPTAVASLALKLALEVMQAKKGNVQLVDWAKSSTLEIVAHTGFDDTFLARFIRVSARDPSACGRALRLRQAVVINDVLHDDGFAPFRDLALRSGFLSVQSTPLLSSSGALFGILSTHDVDPRHPTLGQLSELKEIAESAANAIVTLHVEERMTRSLR
jgi:GAF domain-containing protein